MKNLKYAFIIIISLFLLNTTSFSQGISINTDGADADASAMLDIQSTDGGLLIPRMTTAQKSAITSPANSLLIYQTDAIIGFYYYDGSNWTKLSNSTKKYETIADAEAASGSDNDLCYIIETETCYRYEDNENILTDNNKYVLSTNDGGNTRWLGIAGKYNLNDFSLSQIIHLDASSGSATITNLNQIYYITSASTPTIITIPDANIQNKGYFLRVYKESGNGSLVLKTTSNQNIDGATTATIYNTGKGLFIKSDNSSEWLKIQDSRTHIPSFISISADYDGNSQDFNCDIITANTNSNDITITLPSNISNAPEGNNKMFFNTGTNILFINTSGNTIDGLTDTRVVAPNGYLELQKIDGEVRIIREKNLTIKKDATDIANLECWLDASVLSGTNGSVVSSWTDLENGTIFTASAGEEPLLQTNDQNGKNTVLFDGINDVMNGGDVELHNNTRGFTMVAVVKPTDTKRMAILSKYNTTGNNRQYAFGNRDNFLFEDGTWSSATSCVVTMSQNNFIIVEIVWSPGEVFEFYVNGVLQAMGNNPVTDISDLSTNLKIGCGDYTYVGFWEGNFAEIMVYSDAVSDNDRKSLRDNLAVKWGISEIIITNGGGEYWKRDGNINTISPETDNDNLDIGTGSLNAGTLNISQLINAPALSTAPASPQAGSIYFNTSDNKLKVYTGSVWEDLN